LDIPVGMPKEKLRLTSVSQTENFRRKQHFLKGSPKFPSGKCFPFDYTCLKKRCRVKSINDGQCDTMELWEDGSGKFVTGFRFLVFKIFSFPDS